MDQRQLPDDFKDFIRCLNSNDVHYLLVGGWAVGMYGNPRATKDIDFLVAKDPGNLAKLQNALAAFGSPPVDMEQFKVRGRVIRLGSSPVQIDIINAADGIDIDECYPRKETVKADGVDIFVISRDDLIKNKTASGRSMDIADAENLAKYLIK
jgi:predicted nucleotidyltransferase